MHFAQRTQSVAKDAKNLSGLCEFFAIFAWNELMANAGGSTLVHLGDVIPERGSSPQPLANNLSPSCPGDPALSPALVVSWDPGPSPVGPSGTGVVAHRESVSQILVVAALTLELECDER